MRFITKFYNILNKTNKFLQFFGQFWLCTFELQQNVLKSILGNGVAHKRDSPC